MTYVDSWHDVAIIAGISVIGKSVIGDIAERNNALSQLPLLIFSHMQPSGV